MVGEAGVRTRDLLLPKQARFHCATPRDSNTMILCSRSSKSEPRRTECASSATSIFIRVTR